MKKLFIWLCVALVAFGAEARNPRGGAVPVGASACGSVPASNTWDSASVVPYAPAPGQPDYTFTDRPMALTVDPYTPTTVWVDISDVGLFKSTTCGAPGSWVQVDTGTGASTLNASSIWSLQIDPTPARRGTIYAIFSYGPSDGLWKSTDNGVDWTQVPVTSNASLQPFFWNAVAMDGSNTQHLVVTTHGVTTVTGFTNGAIAETFDGGATWPNVVQMPQAWGEDGGVNIIPGTISGSTSTWVWGTGDGLQGTYLTTNSGASFTQVLSSANDSALGEWNIRPLAKASNGNYYIEAAASMIKSSDGVTWTEAWPEIDFAAPSIATSGLTSSTLFGGGGTTMYSALLSNDAAWSALSPQPPTTSGQDTIGFISFDATDGILYISTFASVFRFNVPVGSR